MPCYIVEPNPPSLLPEAPIGPTRDMLNPSVILRDIKAIEAALPGAKLRGIVLTRGERYELERFTGRMEEDQTLFLLPIVERGQKP